MQVHLAFVLLGTAAGHGTLTLPTTRMSNTMKVGGLCQGTKIGQAPQYFMTCFWFNEGCAIGCKSCDAGKCGHIKSSVLGKCCPEQMEPTLKDPKLRTYSGLLSDIAMDHTPWRAPGFAPVYDPCGIASGVPAGVPPGPINPPPIGLKQGMSMQDLPEMPGVSAPQWPAGSIQDVAWGINANHGGGYAYRLCPKASGAKLPETCFQKHHLQFVGNQSWIQFSDDTSNRTAISAVRTSEGTNPSGSQWTKNPIPTCAGVTGGGIHTSGGCNKTQFEPPLKDVIKGHPKYAPMDGLYGFGMGHCVPGPSGLCTPDELNFWRQRFHFNIIDKVQIPEDLSPGEYLLSLRWDAEQTPQIWTNCADVAIVKPEALIMV